MVRMGKKQELKRQFQFFRYAMLSVGLDVISATASASATASPWIEAPDFRTAYAAIVRTDHRPFDSIWGYAVILGLSWEYALITGVLSLPNGGTAGAVWMFLITCCCMFFVVLSMAEVRRAQRRKIESEWD